jgi:hypothetical protein
MKFIQIKTSLIACCIALLAACGGGGGGGTGQLVVPSAETQTRASLPTVIQDITPQDINQLGIGGATYFPASLGDKWEYERSFGSQTPPDSVIRTVEKNDGFEIAIVETASSSSPTTSVYRKTSAGLLTTDPLEDAPIAAKKLIGELLDWPSTLYTPGAVRKSIRQGSWGEDLDNDGVIDSFRLELSQVHVGTEQIYLPTGIGSTNTVHMLTTISLTLSPSNLDYLPYTITLVEDSWWVANIGLVSSNTVTRETNGSTTTELLKIRNCTINGTEYFGVSSANTMRKLSLTHKTVVYDSTRNLYYASVPSSAPNDANSIATVDPVTGSIAFSAPIGSEPSAMGIAADGSALYVGLNGSGDVVKIRLPDMQLISRIRLPNDRFYGQLYAENIAVSPTNPNVVAVSTLATNVSGHAGLFLIRDDVLQPTATYNQNHVIAFDLDGQYLYGYNNGTTQRNLNKIQVLSSELRQVQTVQTTYDYVIRQLSFSPAGLVLGNETYRSSDLSLIGSIGLKYGKNCAAHSVPNRLLCQYTTSDQLLHIAIVDATSFTEIASPILGISYLLNSTDRVVTGPPGQIALTDGVAGMTKSNLWLFSSPALR